MKHKHILFLLALALPSMATPALAAKEAVRNSIEIPKPPAGKSQVVWFRKGGMGPIIGCSVKEHKEKISSLGSGRYFIMVTDPGSHTYEVSSEATDTLVLDLKPDETKFASCNIAMGLFVGRPKIDLSSEEAFRKVKSLKMVDADDMGPAPGALRPHEVGAALTGQVGKVEAAPLTSAPAIQ